MSERADERASEQVGQSEPESEPESETWRSPCTAGKQIDNAFQVDSENPFSVNTDRGISLQMANRYARILDAVGLNALEESCCYWELSIV